MVADRRGGATFVDLVPVRGEFLLPALACSLETPERAGESLEEAVFEQLRARPTLVVLFAVVAAVLVIACVNLTNLMLARAESRRHEMAVRASLGAGRGRLIRQLLTESLVLCAAGAGAGLGLAYWAIAALVQLAPGNIPRLDQIRVDGTVLTFVAAVTMASAVVSGLVPAIRATRSGLQSTLRDGAKGAGGRDRGRLRGSLVIVEVALALVVLVGPPANSGRQSFRHQVVLPVRVAQAKDVAKLVGQHGQQIDSPPGRTARERPQFVVVDICPVLLCEEVGEHPELICLSKKDCAVPVVVQPLLEYASAKIIGLSENCLGHCPAQCRIFDPGFAGRPCKP